MKGMIEYKDFRYQIKDLDEVGTFHGHASVFSNIDEGGDIVDEGAFTKTLLEKQQPYPLNWYHREIEPIGDVTCKQDGVGLATEGALEMAIQRARELYPLMKKGVIRGLSIGYRTIKEEFEKIAERTIRHIKEAELMEVSLVTFPMNKLAQVEGVKGFDPIFAAVEKALQDPRFVELFSKRIKGEPDMSTLREQIDDDKPLREHLSKVLSEIKKLSRRN
jgi:hypothetical protein